MPPRKPGGARGRKRQKRNNDDTQSEDENEAGPSNARNQMMLEDDDDDVQAEYLDEAGEMVEDIHIPPRYERVEPPTSGERTIIKRIICENFKSYGGIKEMGPFHKSFSSIVGPNGNGKSNIIDAMLFVFGYRAAKIRCKKISVLIHKSELLPDLQQCSVTVEFVKIIDNGQSDDTYNEVSNSSITVKRRAYKTNTSQYWLNNRAVSFQEVATFLKASGIDIVHNRFLILQGEVESIAQMPPKSSNGLETGMLEFFEDVIGTRRYLKCLTQLEERVEQLNYDREGKLQRVDLAEKEKKAMQEPVKKAKDFLRDQNSMTKYRHQMLQFKNSAYTKKTAELNLEIAPVMEKINTVNTRLEEIQATVEARKSEFVEEEKAVTKVKQEHDKKQKSFDTLEAQHLKFSEDIVRTNEQRKKFQKEKVKQEQVIEKLEQIPKNSDREKKQYENRKVELVEQVAATEPRVKKGIEKLNEKINKELKEKAAKDEEFNKWRPKRHEKKLAVEKATKDIEAYKKQDEVESQKLEQFQKDLNEITEKIATMEGEGGSSNQQTELENLKTELRSKENEIVILTQEEAKFKREADALSGRVFEAREMYQSSNKDNDRVQNLFFSERDSGRLPGVYGRMKNLVTIDEKYNVAATVSSSLWDHWLVDNENTADSCIKLLKQHKIDVQNFLCLNRIKHLQNEARRPFNSPPNSQRLFDLLRINNTDLSAAFYKALSNTLVADNLAAAERIAYGQIRYRVATLDGSLIEPTGQMTGGGFRKPLPKLNKGGAATTISKEEYDKLNRDYEAVVNRQQIVSTKKIKLQQDIYELKNQVKVSEERIQNFQGDLENLRKQLPFKKKRTEDQLKIAQTAKVDSKVLKEKEKVLAAAEAEYQQVIEASKDAETAVAEVAEKLQDLEVRQRNEIRKPLDDLQNQLKGVEEEIEKRILDMKNYSKNKKRAEDKIESITTEVESLENNMKLWAQEKKRIEEDCAKLKPELDELQEKLLEAQSTLAAKKGALTEFKEEEKTLAKKKVSYDTKISEATSKLKAYERQMSQNQQAMEALVLKPIPEEELVPLKILSEEEIEALNPKELEHKIAKYEKKLQGETPNLNVLEEYQKKVDFFLARLLELDEVTERRDKFKEAFIKATTDRLSEFMGGFAVIASKLKEMFRMISMGGDAELELVDTTNPFAAGIQFSVRPAKKAWKKISNLSGGEKTLSSLALIFAMHYFKPSPFYVMDEIDAALDFKNVSIIANYIKDRTKFTQFIIISLRSNMFELADTLLGVYKVDNMSYCIHVGVSKLMNVIQRQGNRVTGSQQSTNTASQSQPGPSEEGAANGDEEVAMNVDEVPDSQEQTPISAEEAPHGSQGDNSSGLIIDNDAGSENPDVQSDGDGTTEDSDDSIEEAGAGPGATSTPMIKNASQRRSYVPNQTAIAEENSISSQPGSSPIFEDSDEDDIDQDVILSGDQDVRRYSGAFSQEEQNPDVEDDQQNDSSHSSDDESTQDSDEE